MAARDAGQGNCFSCRAAVSGMRWGGLTFELGEGEDEGDATACSRMAPEKPSFSHGYAFRAIAVWTVGVLHESYVHIH